MKRLLIFVLLAFAVTSGEKLALATEYGKIIITTNDKKTHSFEVEIVSSPQDRARGLMFRRHLAKNQGMLFLFFTPQAVSFWMKNTPIPLDLLFINYQGKISRIAQNTTPFSEEPISSFEPIIAVLEINAGLADQLQIAPGDLVTLP